MSQVTLDEKRVQIVAAADKGNTLGVPKRTLFLPDGERYAATPVINDGRTEK